MTSFKIDLAMTAIVLIQAEATHLVEVEKEIAKMESVISVYDIRGDFDAAVTVRFGDRAGSNAFLKSLLVMPCVKRVVTNVVLNVVSEGFRVNLSWRLRHVGTE